MRKNTGIRTTAEISSWQQKIRVCTFSAGCPKRLCLFPSAPTGTPGTAVLRPRLGSRRAPDTAKPLLCLKELGGFTEELGKLSGSLRKLMHSFK